LLQQLEHSRDIRGDLDAVTLLLLGERQVGLAPQHLVAGLPHFGTGKHRQRLIDRDILPRIDQHLLHDARHGRIHRQLARRIVRDRAGHRPRRLDCANFRRRQMQVRCRQLLRRQLHARWRLGGFCFRGWGFAARAFARQQADPFHPQGDEQPQARRQGNSPRNRAQPASRALPSVRR
jgi:hypothetical protein